MGSNLACCASSETDQALLRQSLQKEKDKHRDCFTPIFNTHNHKSLPSNLDNNKDLAAARDEIAQLASNIN